MEFLVDQDLVRVRLDLGRQIGEGHGELGRRTLAGPRREGEEVRALDEDVDALARRAAEAERDVARERGVALEVGARAAAHAL